MSRDGHTRHTRWCAKLSPECGSVCLRVTVLDSVFSMIFQTYFNLLKMDLFTPLQSQHSHFVALRCCSLRALHTYGSVCVTTQTLWIVLGFCQSEHGVWARFCRSMLKLLNTGTSCLLLLLELGCFYILQRTSKFHIYGHIYKNCLKFTQVQGHF